MMTNANKTLKHLKSIVPETEHYGNVYSVIINVDGFEYCGKAHLHPDDVDFESELVGYTIAHIRAIKKALVAYRDCAEIEYFVANQLLTDIMQNQDPEKVDPTFKLRKKVYHTKKVWTDYQVAVRTTQEALKKYLNNQDKAITSIKRQRELQDKAN